VAAFSVQLRARHALHFRQRVREETCGQHERHCGSLKVRSFMDDKARIDRRYSQLRSWLCDAAYPLWSTRGRDPAGGFHERLTQNGEPLAEPRRSRVNPRQI